MKPWSIVLCWFWIGARLSGQGAAPADSLVTIGIRYSIHSTILDEDRPYWVHAPGRSATNRNDHWPVIVVLDGNAHFHHVTGVTTFLARNGRMPPAYVVAVPNTNRRRDLTPAAQHDTTLQGVGGADRMLDFLTDELLPEIDQRYATTPYRILVGHSLGGLVAMYAWISRPDAFQAYVAASPSLWWDRERLTDSLTARLADGAALPGWFYATMGELEPDSLMLSPFRRAEHVLDAGASPTMEWQFTELANEDHGTTPHRSVYDGLQVIFHRWWLPLDSMVALGVPGLDRHYRDVFHYYRFPEQSTPEVALNTLGYLLMSDTLSTRYAQALDVFRTNAQRFPRSANVYDSLGDAYLTLGHKTAALACFAAAVRTAHAYPDEGTVLTAAAVVQSSEGKLADVARELGRVPWESSAIPERTVVECTEGTAQ